MSNPLLISSLVWTATGVFGMVWGLSNPYPSPNKFYGFGAGAIAATIGTTLSHSATKRSERLAIRQDTADTIFDIGEAAVIENYKQSVFPSPRMPDLTINNHIMGMMPESSQESVEQLDFYNWNDLQYEANAIIVGGNPGSGKTSIVAGYIAPMISRLSESEVIVCDPDASRNHWEQYGYTRVVSDYEAIFNTLVAVAEEKEKRKSSSNKHQIILIVDELNDCQGAWKSIYGKVGYDKSVEAIRTLGNARKYDITPIILMQSHNVMDIGLSKKYRNQYAVILACASAKDEIQNVWKHNDPRFEWVNKNPYACVLVGSIPTQIAQHPTHGHHQQFKKVGNAPSNVLSPVCGNVQCIPDFQNGEREPVYREESKQQQTPKTSQSFDLGKLEKTPGNNTSPDDRFMQILAFCKANNGATVRDVQRSSVGSNLSSDAVKYAFEWLENNGYGTVTIENGRGGTRVLFTPN